MPLPVQPGRAYRPRRCSGTTVSHSGGYLSTFGSGPIRVFQSMPPQKRHVAACELVEDAGVALPPGWSRFQHHGQDVAHLGDVEPRERAHRGLAVAVPPLMRLALVGPVVVRGGLVPHEPEPTQGPVVESRSRVSEVSNESLLISGLQHWLVGGRPDLQKGRARTPGSRPGGIEAHDRGLHDDRLGSAGGGSWARYGSGMSVAGAARRARASRTSG